MSSTEHPTLWELTAAAGPVARRFLLDEHASVPLDVLAGATALGPQRAALRGQNVVLIVGTQRAATLALLELDGLARRIVLCPPDLKHQQLPHVMAMAEARIVVSDRPLPELESAGAVCVVTGAPTQVAGAPEPAADRPTEWVLFTSGTTGPPKLAVHSLRSLTGAIARVTNTAGDQVWSTFYDIRRYGGLQILLRALIGGGSMVLSGAEEPVSDFLARAGAAGVAFISGTPTHWRRALLSPAATAIAPANVRLSGEVADQAILDKLRGAYPAARVAHAFASTEAGVAFEVADGLAGFSTALIGPERPGGITLRVQDDTLRIRSPRAASRYLGDQPEPIADAEGFVDTKDLVVLRDDRYHFAGRKDGVINVGGLKVHPLEVEAVINRHPRVEMSLVKARRSPIIGAIVVADVVLAATGDATGDAGGEGADTKRLETEILDLCRGTLAAYKVPATLRFVPALDVTPSGKLRRVHA